MSGELLEQLAALSHAQWSGWAQWMIDHWCDEIDGVSYMAHWKRQIATPYSGLSEEEKEKDRREARKVLALLSQALADKLGL